jgi:hypothetical protein
MVGLDDIGMNQIGDQLGLADEVIDELLIIGVALADDLDRHPLYEIARAVLLGLIDNPHAALKNFADDFVAKLALNRKECHARMV